MAWCCQATSHCLNQCYPEQGRHMVSLGHKVLISLYFKSWFIILRKNGKLLQWWLGQNYMDGHQGSNELMQYHLFVFGFHVCGFSLITSQLFISWQWKQNHRYWSLNLVLYVLMAECYESMILCVCICKTMSCILFWKGHLLFQEISLS